MKGNTTEQFLHWGWPYNMDVKKMHWSCKFSYLNYVVFDGRWRILKLGALHAYLVVQTMKQHSAPSTNTHWGLWQFNKKLCSMLFSATQTLITKETMMLCQAGFNVTQLVELDRKACHNHYTIISMGVYHESVTDTCPQGGRLIPEETISQWAATPAHKTLYHIRSPE